MPFFLSLRGTKGSILKPVERKKITTETANFFKYAKFGKIHPEVWGRKALWTLIVYTQLKS